MGGDGLEPPTPWGVNRESLEAAFGETRLDRTRRPKWYDGPAELVARGREGLLPP